MVAEESVAVVGGLLGDLGTADGAMPDERGDAVEGPRGGGEGVQRSAEPAFPGHHVLIPEPPEQGVVLDGQVDTVTDVLAEPGIDRAGVAAAEHQIHPAVGEMLQHPIVLSDPHRVGGGDQGGGRGQDDVLGLRPDPGEGRGGRAGDERGVVVLPDGEHIEAHLVGELRDLDGGLDALVLGGSPPGGGVGGHVTDSHDSELHVSSSDDSVTA